MVRTRVATFYCATVVLGLCVSQALLAGDKPIRNLTLDETAPVVALFDGIDEGQLKVHFSPKSPQESRVSIKNLTDATLTVALPKAAIGVHILPQFQQPQQQQGFFNQTGNNNGQQNSGGQSQSVGGQFQSMGNQGQGFPQGSGQNLFQGSNFFSIPPEKTVQLKLKTVCLNYGWPDPLPGMKYELRSVEAEISNPALRKLIELDSPRIDDQAKQAAAWHLANGLTWNQLSRIPKGGVAMFPPATLKSAQGLVDEAVKAAEKGDEETVPLRAAAQSKVTSVRGR